MDILRMTMVMISIDGLHLRTAAPASVLPVLWELAHHRESVSFYAELLLFMSSMLAYVLAISLIVVVIL